MKKLKIDKPLFIVTLILVVFGLFMVYSASNVVAVYKYDDSFYFLKRQLLFSIIGFVIMFLIIKVDINKIYKNVTLIFIISLLLLILVLIPGIGVVRGGARSWIGFGSLSIQPAEFMKLGIILLISKYLSKYQNDLKKFKNFLGVLLLVILVFGLIMLQPDFGTGLVLVVSIIILLFCTQAPIRYFLFLLCVGILGIIGLIISEPYRMMRILAYLDPWSDPLGSGFQTIQSLFAVAPSGIFGLGYNNSLQKHFFLPEPQNDFIFAIICEELGLIGSMILLGLFIFMILRIIRISNKVEDQFHKFLSLGIGISLFVQVFINIGVVIGLLPVTGITLPFISYGGSSLILTLVMIAVVLNISKYQED